MHLSKSQVLIAIGGVLFNIGLAAMGFEPWVLVVTGLLFLLWGTVVSPQVATRLAGWNPTLIGSYRQPSEPPYLEHAIAANEAWDTCARPSQELGRRISIIILQAMEQHSKKIGAGEGTKHLKDRLEIHRQLNNEVKTWTPALTKAAEDYATASDQMIVAYNAIFRGLPLKTEAARTIAVDRRDLLRYMRAEHLKGVADHWQQAQRISETMRQNSRELDTHWKPVSDACVSFYETTLKVDKFCLELSNLIDKRLTSVLFGWRQW